MRLTSRFEKPRRLGLISAAASVGLGVLYLSAAGAPSRYMALNAAAFLVGLAAFATIALPRWQLSAAKQLILPGLGALLLATALFGVAVDGASRWATIGPLNLQVSLIVLPVMLVQFARAPHASGAAGLCLAALALALQPDRAMAGVLVAGLAVLAVRRRDRAVLVPLAASVFGFAATLLRPDQLPAVPFVDQILYSSFAIGSSAGAAVVGGACLMLLPTVTALLGERRPEPPILVFGAAWLAVLIAAAAGNYPTPLVGYGGSAIVGYLLSLALLPARSRSLTAKADSDAPPVPEQEGRTLSANLA